MLTSVVQYPGALRTKARHQLSGNEIFTDAPPDNSGKGESFSPSDLVATALASCMITIMGILENRDGMTPIKGVEAEVKKVMYPDPRRIGEIHIRLKFPENNYSEKEKKSYEHAAHTCPVAKSIHPDIKQVISFEWPRCS